MKEFLRDFHRRVAEIDKYFDLVDKIEQLGAFSTSSIIFPSGEYVVDSDLQKILKSHCYLLLYNLIESSVKNGIAAIHDSILVDKLTYKELNQKIKKLWLLNDQSKSFRDSYIKKETVADNLYEAIRAVLDDEILTLDPTNIPISGNLDAKTIKGIIDMYGFYGNLGVPDKEIDELLNFAVKIRCDLAHGNVSFCDASNQITWSKLINDKNKLVKYLTHLLQNIDDYIDKKKYKL
ncbi:MAE_28990/MAE_18760 family HEPN-like nuclease [Nostoc sp. DedQUE09]|uniref:MAE_28990/MAE_18760 family HEPN-like nuclease n=1 Tax=Nostoc sp. DedQUE09 TaxID=3075394 RepID=UPI002AD3EEB4|nr:MAE_28990/MAE_18760 family HEPN-like nuclease [Nostoc sp. DedQUE09]MDZ7953540.1 MAE_28990/MAE_18760 family HEPN-like nuclease [Nostoc sp. DedQUE09]